MSSTPPQIDRTTLRANLLDLCACPQIVNDLWASFGALTDDYGLVA